MELKKLIKTFVKNWILFVVTILVVLGIGAVYKYYKASRPISYEVSLLLNVTRDGIQNTETYRYDDFYRLQADERFADTVVRWLQNPRIVSNVFNETGKVSGDVDLGMLSKVFDAKRLSSQMIDVRFDAESARDAQDISVAITQVINKETKSLNQYQKEDSWFKIIGDEPVIKENKTNWKDILPIFSALGVFLGIWVVLIKHYLTSEQ